MILSAALLRQRIEPRVAAGGVLGAAGIQALVHGLGRRGGFGRRLLWVSGSASRGRPVLPRQHGLDLIQRQGIAFCSPSPGRTLLESGCSRVDHGTRPSVRHRARHGPAGLDRHLRWGLHLAFRACRALARIGAARAGCSKRCSFRSSRSRSRRCSRDTSWTGLAVAGVVLALAGNDAPGVACAGLNLHPKSRRSG